jgi:F420-dependent oxidoreductase-like protein
MEIGLHVPNFTLPGGPASLATTLTAIAEASEASGLTHLSVMDHFFQLEMMGKPEDEMLEGYTTLGYLAAKTSRIRLGLLVTGVTYRRPGLLAKIVTTLDVLSQGRAQLGIGAAWFEREHVGLGVPFPPVPERLQWLEETLQICLKMWSDDNGPFEGKHFQLAECLNSPQCIQRPHPPILIGGGGEKVLLKLVARYANAWNYFSSPGVDGVQAKMNILRKHCDTQQRDYDAIKKTLLWTAKLPGPDTADAFLKQAEAFAKIGMQQIIVMPMSKDPVAQVEGLAPIAKRLAEI